MARGTCPEDRHLSPEDRPGEDLPTSLTSLSHPGLLLVSASFRLELYSECMGWVCALGTGHCAEGFDTFHWFLLTRLSGAPTLSDPHFFFFSPGKKIYGVDCWWVCGFFYGYENAPTLLCGEGCAILRTDYDNTGNCVLKMSGFFGVWIISQ